MRKYQNEWMVLLGFVVLLGGFLYQQSMHHKLENSLDMSRSTARQITETRVFQKVWSTKGLKAKVSALKNVVSSDKIKTFDQKKKKLTARFEGLNGKELNTLSTRLASIPVHIQELAVTRSGKQYSVRCQCTW